MEKHKRDVKFRFTFKDGNFFAKRYMTLDELLDSNFALEQMEESINEDSNIFDLEDYPDYEVFKDQCTNKKDKNNIEIYRGDIIEAFDILGEREIYSVVFINGAFMGKRLDDEEFPYFYLFANTSLFRTYKVIGNIYENPNLLKG